MLASTPAATPLLAPGQVAQYDDFGYCIVDSVYSADEIRAMEEFFEEFKHSGVAVFDGGSRIEEIDPKQRQVRAMHPHRYSERVQQWALHPRAISVLAALLRRDPLLAQTMYYFKPPGAKGQGMHQDNFYLLAAPATCIAAWTPIDDADLENGCLYVVPQSHRKEILCPKDGAEPWMQYGDSHIKPFPRDARPVPVPVQRGQTMFFSGNLIHGSGPNRTRERSRRTFIGHYIDEASEQVARFYHPVLNKDGEVLSQVRIPEGGGPCGDGWLGAQH